MAVFRIERTRDYTVMSNHHLRNANLSLKAKGLLSMMLSLPEDWNYTTRGLAKICKEGVDAIGAALRELEGAGYIVRHQRRDKSGRITDTEYVIYEQPQPDLSQPDTASPDTENPDMVKPDTEKPAELNMDEIATYVRPKTDMKNSWEDVPEDIKNTFDALGIPEAEKKSLAGVGAQYDSEVVYHSIKEELVKQGVIYTDMETAVREYEDIVKEHYG